MSSLAKYDRHEIIIYPHIKVSCVTFDPFRNMTYAWGLNSNQLLMYRTTDGGATWDVDSRVVTTPLLNNFVPLVVAAAVDRENIYLVTTNLYRQDEYFDDYCAIFKRNKTTGGDYELLFCAPEGPNFISTRYIAVSPDGRIMAVGYCTSVYYDGEKWLLQELPMKNSFSGVVWGGDGFYAVADNGMSMPRRTELLYHP